MRLPGRLEYATEADPAFNYCLWEYEPPTPAEDGLRSVNLLYQSFDAAGLDGRADTAVDLLRDAIGPFRTVFGIKLIDGRLAWEFYFYDYGRRAREVSISRVLVALRPLIPCSLAAPESTPYFMFSLDFDSARLAGAAFDVVHMYVGHPSASVSTGIAYAVRAGQTVLENFYFFYDARTQLDQVAAKVTSSAMFDETKVPLSTVLLPELCVCRTICCANKQTHDCIYFSGVTIDQLVFFLARFGYPPSVQAWVGANRAMLAHLLFDVGFDYRMDDGGVRVLKSGYYGVF